MEYHLRATIALVVGILLISLAFLVATSALHFPTLIIFSNVSLSTHLISNTILSLGVILFLMGAITEIKHKSSKLSSSSYSDLISAEISTAYISTKWRCIKVNNLCGELFGYHANELAKMDFQRLLHPDDFKRDAQYFQQLLTHQIQKYAACQRYLDKNGDLIELYVSVTLNTDNKNKPFFVFHFQKM